ncbi:MAG: RdgB/HAM1 family non-canonical purine NTP pyrophosphatase [Bacteroidetes bacterium]|nr:RdgB/HAM1 family non-canonical purine NTP pyrophosphatase [Bacteroidota bacterium]
MERKLIFATGNLNKLNEVQQIIADSYILSTPADNGINEDIPETSQTIKGNALQKARYVFSKTGLNCFADDTGLEIDSLDGEPGVRSARYAGENKSSDDNMDLVLDKMEAVKNRDARFRTVIALILDGVEYLFEGVVEGEMLEERCGTEGFGYDSIFRPKGYDKTFAQMTMAEKNPISHRGIAVAKLVDFLKDE